MKIVFSILWALVFSSLVGNWNINAQNIAPDEQEITSFDTHPKFNDCPESDGSEAGFKKCLAAYVQSHLKNTHNRNGRVLVSFRIEPTGKARVLHVQGRDSLLNQEARQLIEQLPELIAAQKDNKSVAYNVNLPFTFEKFIDVFSANRTYYHTVDVFPKWNFSVIDSESGAEFHRTLSRFFHQQVQPDATEKQHDAHLLIRVTSEGDVAIRDIFCENEQLGQKIIKASKRLPKAIPARKNGKVVSFETTLSISFSNNENEMLPPDQWVKIASCGSKKELTQKAFKKCLDEFVIQNFVYPKKALESNIQGTVYVIFKITPEKKVEIKALLNGEPILQAMAYYIIEKLPIELPAYRSGKAVPVSLMYPIVFRIRD
ncbi:energy transducer TonB [Capnocytophaga sp.]|uniref:energy transducer TonB n=1 Tax=Capnocytophaga sp. TaxID=44737 RepID=UPI0026DACBD7|nr:energy transducer TonB [Capnocytophaga sp.]MDO5106270.1 energy transducer TonB [Capnocytophaga sp.]